ncbi:nucleotidyltransferase domain-containing protein [Sporosarcina highlanderae]|uniref:Nucleotidyltransferase domain-containing protein n=1 Tax=Sporosarcina highlanderae TaxID=3035916 RepID=A0ABT8JMQ7_9BACL|nr:nucleotidyltransferase domain-containing protein [Sporosarcina highlanderae]MDN4606443.1 nucleotidyltransferase domain-containing protein [Sporosarcina highlanderae]
MKRMEALFAANRFVDEYYPQCQAAVLAGSVVRGEETPTSDLDIVIFDNQIQNAYRESRIEYNWPIEVFVHTLTSYKTYFQTDAERARPTLPRMVAEGIVLVDAGILSNIKNEAAVLLNNGPAPWSEQTLLTKRYMLTDALGDLLGTQNEAEALFIANTLGEAIHEFVLRTNGKWIGASKWIIRALKQYDEDFANRFVSAFHSFYKTGDREGIINITDEVLAPYGGRLFEGYSLGK